MKLVKYLSLGIVVLFAAIIIWWNLPLEINRYADISAGDQIIENINDFYSLNNKLPQDQNLEELSQMGFDTTNGFENPQYFVINDTAYELVYVEGFDGPYLMWNSNEKIWKMDNPSYADYKRTE